MSKICEERCRTPLSTSVGLGKISNLILISDPGDSRIVFFSEDSQPICWPVPLWEWRMVTPGFIWWHIDHSLTRKDLSGCPFFIYLCEKIYPHYLFFLQFHVNLSLPSGIYKWRLRIPLPRLVGKLLMHFFSQLSGSITCPCIFFANCSTRSLYCTGKLFLAHYLSKL